MAAGSGEGGPRFQATSNKMADQPACRQHQPPASGHAGHAASRDDCWLLIRSVSSLRPAGNGQAQSHSGSLCTLKVLRELEHWIGKVGYRSRGGLPGQRLPPKTRLFHLHFKGSKTPLPVPVIRAGFLELPLPPELLRPGAQ